MAECDSRRLENVAIASPIVCMLLGSLDPLRGFASVDFGSVRLKSALGAVPWQH